MLNFYRQHLMLFHLLLIAVAIIFALTGKIMGSTFAQVLYSMAGSLAIVSISFALYRIFHIDTNPTVDLSKQLTEINEKLEVLGQSPTTSGTEEVLHKLGACPSNTGERLSRV